MVLLVQIFEVKIMPIVTVFELARCWPHVGLNRVTGADSRSVHQLVGGTFTRQWALSLVLELASAC